MSDNVMDGETERQLNDYQEYISTFVEGFSAKIFSDGVLDEVSMEKLQEYFTNPDDNNEILTDLAEYFYITSGEVHMMFELIEALPNLNYKINTFEKMPNHDKHVVAINKAMHKMRHKPLVRDVLKQTAVAGTLTGIWLGNKHNIHPYIFDDPTKVFPAYRMNGDWVVHFDLAILDDYTEFYREIMYKNLSPYVTKKMYDKYSEGKSPNFRHVELPQDRTFVVHTHKLKRNQGLGTGWANSGMFDVLHKRKLKNVERAIANKIINAIAVLTIGNDKHPDKYGNVNLNPKLKRRVFSGVKKALEAAERDGIPVVALPEFASLDFPDVKADGLDGKKFNHVNNDISASLGVSGALTHGEGGSHSSSKVNLEIFYKRIAVILEQIDTDMIQKLINIIVPNTQRDNYYLVYDKGQPLTTKEKVDILIKLNDKGWSVKHVVDELSDVSWEQYLEQTLHETDDLKLQKRITPYKTSHTTSSKDSEGGAPEKDELTPEGESTRDSGKNED